MFRNKETLQSRGEMNYGEDKRTDGHASEMGYTRCYTGMR